MNSYTQNHIIGTIVRISIDKSEYLFLISERLRDERNRINKTQEELAACLGLSARTWGKYEKRIIMPDAYTLFALEKEGIDIYYILTGIKLPVGLDSENEEKIIKQYRNADDGVKFAVNSIFNALKL